MTPEPDSTEKPASHRWAMRSAAVAVLLLAVGIATNRLYDVLRTPVGDFDRMISDMKRINSEIGPALSGVGYGWRFDMPPGLAPMFERRQLAPEAGGRSIVVSRNTSRPSSSAQVSKVPRVLEAAPQVSNGAPVPQGVVPGGEGEIELRNDTEADATLVLAAAREPDRILKSSPLPAGGGAIVRGLRPEIYTLDVTFADYPRSPIRLGPLAITQTATPEGTVADRYEIHLRPRPAP